MIEFIGAIIKLAERLKSAANDKAICEKLATQAEKLLHVLKNSLSKIELTRLNSPAAKYVFDALKDALTSADSIVVKINKLNTFSSIFKARGLYEDLKDALDLIQANLGSISLLLFENLHDVRDGLGLVKDTFTQVVEDVKDVGDRTILKQHDLASKVLHILQHGGENQLDQLISWLADEFHSEVSTLKKEWQDMKSKAINFKDSKLKLEELFLRQLVLSLHAGAICSKCCSPTTDPIITCKDCINSERQIVTSSTEKQQEEDKQIQRGVHEIGSKNNRNTVWNGLQLLLQYAEPGPEPDASQRRIAILNAGAIQPILELLKTGVFVDTTATLLWFLTKNESGINDHSISVTEELARLLISGVYEPETCAKFAGALVSMLKAPGVREYTLSRPGVVSSLFKIGIYGQKALAKLAKMEENREEINTHVCLLNLSRYGGHVREESLTAFLSLMEVNSSEGAAVLNYTELVRDHAGFLIIIVVGRTSGPAHEASILILEHFARNLEGKECLLEEYMIDNNFSYLIPKLVQDIRSSNNLQVLRALVGLSTRCLSAETKFSSEFHTEWSKDLISQLLEIKNCMPECLAMLGVLCNKFEVCKVQMVEQGGLKFLQDFIGSTVIYRKEAIELMRTLLEVKSIQTNFVQSGGIQLLQVLISSDNGDLAEIIALLELLGKNSDFRNGIAELKVTQFLQPRYSGGVNMAAESLIFNTLISEGKHLKVLEDFLTTDYALAMRIKAGGAMLQHVNTDTVASIGNCLRQLVKIAEESEIGQAYCESVINFFALYGEGSSIYESEGLPMLLHAFTRTRHEDTTAGATTKLVEDATEAIRRVVESVPAAQELVIISDFKSTSLRYLRSSGTSITCLANIAGSMLAIYPYTGRRMPEPDILLAFINMLKDESVASGKKLIAVDFLANYSGQKLVLEMAIEDFPQLLLLKLKELRQEPHGCKCILKLMDDIITNETIGSSVFIDIVKTVMELLNLEELPMKHEVQELAIRVVTKLSNLIKRDVMIDKIMPPLRTILAQNHRDWHEAIFRSAFLIQHLLMNQRRDQRSVRDANLANDLLRVMERYVCEEGRRVGDTLNYIMNALGYLPLDKQGKQRIRNAQEKQRQPHLTRSETR